MPPPINADAGALVRRLHNHLDAFCTRNHIGSATHTFTAPDRY